NMIQPNHGQSLSQRNSSSATFGYSAQIAACEQEAVAVSKEGPFPSVRLEKIYHRQHALRAQAAKDFAALNSWQVSLTPFPLFALTPKAFRSTGDHKLSADTLWRASSCFISGGQATTPAGSHRRATAPCQSRCSPRSRSQARSRTASATPTSPPLGGIQARLPFSVSPNQGQK